MSIYEFDIREKPIQGTNYFSWVAIERGTSVEVPLPDGGNGDFIGKYPEIESYLKEKYNIDVGISYRSRSYGDDLEINDCNVKWIFSRGDNKIMVNDIHRTVLRIGIYMSGENYFVRP